MRSCKCALILSAGAHAASNAKAAVGVNESRGKKDSQSIFSVNLLYIDYSFGIPLRRLAEVRDELLLFNLVSFQRQNPKVLTLKRE